MRNHERDDTYAIEERNPVEYASLTRQLDDILSWSLSQLEDTRIRRYIEAVDDALWVNPQH
jgi:hypothetical protein